jgi:hypothetical protein
MHDHEEQVSLVDLQGPLKGPGSKVSLLHVQKAGKGDGELRMASLPAHKMGLALPFQATPDRGHVEQAHKGESLRNDLRVHSNIPGTCGDRRALLLGVIPAGLGKIHGAAWNLKQFQSDQRTQLVVASKQVGTWDWSRVWSPLAHAVSTSMVR